MTTSGDAYLDPYRRAVEEHGASFEATLWGSRAAQVTRFDVMIDLMGGEGRRILDIGCGRGDLAVRLIERSVEFAAFVGVDAMPSMIEWAREQSYPRCDFEAADLVADPQRMADWRPDIVCISGALNTMDDDTAHALVRAGFEHASEGIVFNFLSNRPAARWADRDLTPARRFDTTAWLDWAMSLTSRVAFTQAYLDGHDATIAMWHDGEE